MHPSSPEPTLVESVLQPAWLETQGRKEGRYIIGPLLGQGGMGEVYEAWDIVLARPVALKILRNLEPAAMIRFMNEAQLQARLDYPNICKIYDIDASNGTPRIAMQLIRGPNLEDAADDLSLEQVVSILAQVAEAVHGAHQVNLIHRDIKPSNILLQWKEHRGWVPFICDFGLAMALDGPSVTQPLAMTGTPAYMAPEQVRGDRALVGPPTDVYGIGSTLYFALVGRPPCVTTTTAEMLQVKRERRFPRPRALEPRIPPALETILFKCLEPSTKDRYATALELAAALRGVLDTLSAGLAPKPSLRARLRTLAGNRRRTLPSLAVALGLAATLPFLPGYLLRQRLKAGEPVQFISLESSNLEQSIRNERMMPVHDLRPARNRTRTRMAALKAKAAALGARGDGPACFALGRAHFLLEDFNLAKVELGKAWSAGFEVPTSALMLALLAQRESNALTAQAAFLGHAAPPRAAEALALAGQYLAQAKPQTSYPNEFIEALENLLQGNHSLAAGAAGAALKANPWSMESAVLGAGSLALLAKARLDAGDTEGAELSYQEALDLANGSLALSQSCPRLHHAACAAALGLAAIDLERGDLTQTRVANLLRQADRALEIDPDNQPAQSDWLQMRTLKALRLRGLGQDTRPALDEALQFYWSRTREPRNLDLRMDHMVLYWLQAERDFDQNGDPGPSLAEALKDPGHTFTRYRDFLGDLLNFKARWEISRGQDPRGTLETVAGKFEPQDNREASASSWEIAAKARLVRAEWELLHQIDPAESLRRAQTLLKRALESRPSSAAGHALLGQCQVLEAESRPAERKALIAQAGENLRSSRRLNPEDRDLSRLQSLLPRP